jgi:hypothetical protein
MRRISIATLSKVIVYSAHHNRTRVCNLPSELVIPTMFVCAINEGHELDLNMLNVWRADLYERLREIEAHKAEARASSILAGLQFDDQEMRTKPSKVR